MVTENAENISLPLIMLRLQDPLRLLKFVAQAEELVLFFKYHLILFLGDAINRSLMRMNIQRIRSLPKPI